MRLPTRTFGWALAAIMLVAARPTTAGDLRDAVPSRAFLATHYKHNPERDYQKAYHAAVWKEVEDTQIIEKFLGAIQGRMSDQEREQFAQGMGVLENALKPVDWDAVANCTESVYAQEMALPSPQHLLMMRIPGKGAASLKEGMTNLFKIVEQASQGQVPVTTQSIGGVSFTTLDLPPQVPIRPFIGTTDDGLFILTSSADMAEESLRLLKNPGANSKFDDPRVAAALKHLPAAEDSLTFFDGRALFEQLRGIEGMIKQQAQGDEEANRVAAFIGEVVDQVAVIDHEVTVEYTQEYQNRTAAFGKYTDDVDQKVIGKMLGQAKPFENWNRWVPANATGYSLSSGANLHPLYAWIVKTLPMHFPQTAEGIARMEEAQKQLGIHLDRDILQSFSGESVSLSLPGSSPSPLGQSSQSVWMTRCTNPDRIKALLHRGFEKLQEIPDVQRQGLALKPVADLEGFEEISVNMFAMLGIRPVIGFRDGWMAIGSHADAVRTVLETRSGKGETITSTEAFKQFDLSIDGPVASVAYSNLGDGTRATAQALQQAGAMLPMVLGMAGRSPEDIKPVQDFLGLLPSVGRIIGKMDFYDAQLSVVKPGESNTYTKHSVTLIKPPTGR